MPREENPMVMLNVGPTFDRGGAAALVRALREAPPGATVLIDFTRAKMVQDHALALFALASCRGSAVRVRVTGLCEHSRRLLAYLGVEAGSLKALS